jgi:fibronectin type 3 domain-containing protein
VSYQIQYSEDGQNFNTVFSQTNRIGIETLKPGTCYVYRIVTICPGGSASAPTPGEFCTEPATPQCNRPASVQVEVRSETTAFIVWSPVSAARDYLIEISTDNQNFTPAAVSERSEFLLENLQPNTRYFVRIRSRCGEATVSDPTQPREFRTSAPCPVVEGLVLAELVATEAVVRWTAAPGAQQYEVWVQTGTGQPQLNQTVTATQAVIRPLIQGTVYRVYIVTVCNEGRKSGPSSTLEFESQRPDCPTPSGLQVSNVSQQSARVSWTAVPAATAYRVSLSNNGGQTYDLIFTAPTHTGFVVQPLNPGTNYLVRVQTICANEVLSAPSQPQGFRTLQGFSCPAPTSVSVSQIASTSAFVSWPRVVEAIQYEITYTGPSGSQTLPRQAATSVFLNNLSPQTTFVITVRSICANDSLSTPSNPREFTTVALPQCPTPREVRVELVNSTTASISWSSVSGALSYQVVLYDAQRNVIREWISPTPNAEAQNLVQGTAYFVAVRSICANQVRSDLTDLVPFETPAPVQCPRPANLEVVSRTTDAAVVEWTPVAGAVSYEVSVSRDGGNTFQNAITQLPRAELAPLASGDVLIVRVRTLCSGDRFSPYTEPIEVRPASPTDCPVPAGIEIGNLTPTTAFVSWPPVTGATAYEVSYETTSGWIKLNITQRTNQLISGLMPGTAYRVRVRAVCANGQFSNPTEPRPFTTPQQSACTPPASIGASRIESNLIRLNWPRVSGALGYEVAFSSDGGNTFSVRITQDTLLLLSSLQAGVNYVIRIRTLCTGNVYSDPVFNEFRTPLPNECPAPRNVRIAERGVNFLLVRWDAAPSAIRYQVEYRRVGDPQYMSLAPTTDLVRELVNLTPEDTFEVRVRSICGEQSQNVSPYSEPVTGITDPLPQSCPEVNQLFFPNVRSDRAVIEWNIPQGPPQPISYDVLFSRDGGQTFESLSVSTNRVEIDRLRPQTTYFVKVRSVCVGNVVAPESSTGSFTTTGEDICPVPVPFVSSLSSTEASVSWPRVFGALIYEISSSNRPNGPFGNTQYTQDTSWKYNNLVAGDTLFVRVRAACSLVPSLFSNYSGTLQVVVPVPFCSAPSEVAFSQIGSNSAAIEWPRSSSPIASGYRIRISGDGGRTFDTLLTTGTRLLLNDLKPATTYLVYVSTLCLGNRSSDEVSGDFRTLPPQGCTTPQNLEVRNVTSNSAEISWNTVPGALGYQLAYKETQSQFFTTVTLTANTYVIPGLAAERRYLVQVRAICDTSSTPYTPWTDQMYFETKPFVLACPAPESIDIRPGQTTATLTWPAIPNATMYLVAYGEASALNLLSISVPTNQITLSNLRPNTTYKVRIRVTCGNDRSVFTPTVQFTTLAPREDAVSSDLKSLTLYPNPARSQANIRFTSTEAGVVEVKLLDLSGRQIYQSSVLTAKGNNESTLSLEGLPAGLYLVQLEVDGYRSVTKLWIQD